MGGGPVVRRSTGEVITLLNDDGDTPPPIATHTRPTLSRPGRLSTSPELRVCRPEAPTYGSKASVYGSPVLGSSSQVWANGPPAAAYSPQDPAYGLRVPGHCYQSSDHGHKTPSAWSIPPTPELSRSDSYDSRMTAEPISPMTPVYEFSARYQPLAKDPRSYPDEHPTDAQFFHPTNKRKASALNDGPSVKYEDERTAIPASPSGSTLGAEKPPQKRFPCRFRDELGCDKTFTTSGHASRHSKIHTAEKGVPCSYPGCPKKFTRSDNMKQHLDTHFKDRSRMNGTSSRPTALSQERGGRPTPPLASELRQKRSGSSLAPSSSPAHPRHSESWSKATDASSRRSSVASLEPLGAPSATPPSPGSTAATSASPGDLPSPGAIAWDMRELHGHLDHYQPPDRHSGAAAAAVGSSGTTRLDTLVMVAERKRQEME